MNNFKFSQNLLVWYDEHGRKDLPWQQHPTAYHVWLSEIMLQQTQVSTVIPYYLRFLESFPNVESLAKADIDDVLSLWSGLGYYARARNLHKAARQICDQHNGKLPANLDQLIALPGIGRSTAGAIMSLAFHQRYPILDGNVKRVLTRFAAIEGWPGNKQVENQLWQLAETLLPEKRFANYIQAQMDLGATLCKRTKPACSHCPLVNDCKAYQLGTPTAFPHSKPKKTIPTRQTHWLVLQNQQQQVWLEQRPMQGIWGGLWSLPELAVQENVSSYLNGHAQLDFENIVALPDMRHIFSHFKLEIKPHLVTGCIKNGHISENNRGKWYRIGDALELGLPAPVKSLLQSLDT